MSNAQALVEQALAAGSSLDDLAASLDAAELQVKKERTREKGRKKDERNDGARTKRTGDSFPLSLSPPLLPPPKSRQQQAPFAAGDPLLPPWPAAAHLLAHAGNASSSSSSSSSSEPSGERTSLDDARFLWRRLPPASREQPAAAAAFALLQALWLPDPVAAWGVLRSSFGLHGGGGDGGGATTADPALAALAARVASGLRSRVAAVLPRAFSRISLPKAAALLGFSDEEAAAFGAFVAGQVGWEVSENVLSLPRPSSAAAAAAASVAFAASAASAAAALAASEDELSKLSKYILQLEAGA